MKRFALFIVGAVLLSAPCLAQDSETIEVRWSRGYKNREIQLDYVTSLDSANFMTYGSTSRSLLRKAKYYYARYDRQSMGKFGRLKKSLINTKMRR